MCVAVIWRAGHCVGGTAMARERGMRLLVACVACKGNAVVSGVLPQLGGPGRRADDVASCAQRTAFRLCTRRRAHAHMRRPAGDLTERGETARLVMGCAYMP